MIAGKERRRYAAGIKSANHSRDIKIHLLGEPGDLTHRRESSDHTIQAFAIDFLRHDGDIVKVQSIRQIGNGMSCLMVSGSGLPSCWPVRPASGQSLPAPSQPLPQEG